jgi:hypothetical protein
VRAQNGRITHPTAPHGFLCMLPSGPRCHMTNPRAQVHQRHHAMRMLLLSFPMPAMSIASIALLIAARCDRCQVRVRCCSVLVLDQGSVLSVTSRRRSMRLVRYYFW